MRNAALTSPPKKPIVRPAIAGPTMRAPLKIARVEGDGVGARPRGPTISTVNAWRVGMSTALVMPRIVASTRICHTCTVSVTTSANRMKASVIWTAWVAISVWRLGRASAIRPPNSPSRSTGQERERRRQAEDQRVAGELEDEPRLGDLLHPGPDEADELAAEEQPVVAVAERPAAVGEREARAGGGARRGPGRGSSGGPPVGLRAVAGLAARRRCRRGGRRDARGGPRPRRSSPRCARSCAAGTPTWRSIRPSVVEDDRAALGEVARSSGSAGGCGSGPARPRAAGRSRRARTRHRRGARG